MRRPRLSYANVISSLALFVALGGTGYAVSQLPRNSVGNRQLKASAVTSSKIRNNSVQRSDLAPAARGGSRGPRGAAGPSGAQGPAGPSETIQVKRPDGVSIPTSPGGTGTISTVTLPPGAWMLQAQARIIYLGTGGSEFFDCDLRTATGELLQRGTLRVGEDAIGTGAGTIPLQVAANLVISTQVLFSCTHPSAIPGNPTADQATLLATRLGGLENR